MKRNIFFLGLLMIASVSAFAGGDKECPVPKAPKPSAEFERLKGLAGTWKGTSEHAGKKEDVEARYQVTSGGRAIVETLMPGTPHEMVSVYYEEKGKLKMTHYCMLGNRPVLELKKSGPEGFRMELAKNSGIGKKELHMHALKLTFGKDQLTQEWTGYNNGKPQETSVFSLNRAA